MTESRVRLAVLSSGTARQAISGKVTLLITGSGWAPKGQAGFVCLSWESRKLWPFRCRFSRREAPRWCCPAARHSSKWQPWADSRDGGLRTWLEAGLACVFLQGPVTCKHRGTHLAATSSQPRPGSGTTSCMGAGSTSLFADGVATQSVKVTCPRSHSWRQSSAPKPASDQVPGSQLSCP